MAAAPGWYADQNSPTVMRWWDGVQWTPHTSPSPEREAEPFRVLTPPPAAPTRGRGRIVAVIVGLTVILVVVAAVAAGSEVRHQVAIQGPPDCGTVVRPGMSAPASAYVRIVTTENRAAEALSRQIRANPTSEVTNNQIEEEIALKTAFREGLMSIPFDGAAASDAQNVNAGLQSLINDLNTALVSPSADVTAQINADWANANTARLRTDLGLPQSTCNFLTAT